MNDKTKLPMQVTPRGHAAYAWLAKKDTKFSKEGVYKVTLVLDKENIQQGRQDWGKVAVDGKQWVKDLIALSVEHGAGAFGDKNCPVKDGDKTGKDEFKGKLLIPFKSTFKPAMVDTKQNPLPGSLTVFSGDEVKVLFKCNPVEAQGTKYLSLYMNKVMLCAKNSAGNDMFGEEEDGFVVSEADTQREDWGDDEQEAVTEVDQGGDF
jgi:hypothetical protein